MAPKPTGTGGGKGVRVATAYVEIAADTSGIPDQIKDALNQAGSKNARQAGEQIGKEVATGINEGLKKAPSSSSGSILDDVVKGKPVGAGPRAQGKKVGQEVAKGIDEGIKSGGGKIDEAIIENAKPKETGKKVGKEIKEGIDEGLEDAGKGPLDVIKESVKDFGREIADDLKRGDIQEAFSRVGDVVSNTTTAIDNLGNAVGVNLESVGNFGQTAATTLDTIGGELQSTFGKVRDTADQVKGIADNVKQVGQGDTPTRIGAIADSLDRIGKLTNTDLSGISKPIHDIADAAVGVAALKESLAGIVTLSPAVAAALSEIAGPLAILAAGGWAIWNGLPGVPGGSLRDILSQPNPTKGVQSPLPSGPLSQAPAAQLPRPGQVPAAPPGYTATPGDINNPFGALLPPGWTLQNGKLVPPSGNAAPASPGAPSIPDIAPPDVGGVPGRPSSFRGGGTPQQAVHGVMLSAGFGESEWGALNQLISGESSWQPTIRNPSSGAYGLFQFLGHEGDKYGALGGYSSDPAQQAVAGMAYIRDRYGSPSNALAAWNSRSPHWYQSGGPVDEDQLAKLHAGEHVLTAGDVAALGGQAGVQDMRDNLASGGKADSALDTARTLGFIPTGAGAKNVAGTSFVAGILNLGNEAVGGLIDTAASAAQMAASAAMAGASMGGSTAGGPAASIATNYGIQLAANEGKRAVSYGFQMASIAADSLIDQIFGPFGGPPRWIGYDYTPFLPSNIGGLVGQIGTTTVEKAFQAAKGGQQQSGQQPGGPTDVAHLPGSQPVGPPLPKFGSSPAPQALGGGADMGGLKTPGGAPPPPPPPPEAPGSGPTGSGPFGGIDIHNLFGFDQGGVLLPNMLGFNTTGRPELILSPQQMGALGPMLGGRNPYAGGDTFHITTIDAQGVGREIDKRKRLAMMQYAGRP